MARDWRDERIEELERLLAAAVAQNAELARQLKAALGRIAELEEKLAKSSRNSYPFTHRTTCATMAPQNRHIRAQGYRNTASSGYDARQWAVDPLINALCDDAQYVRREAARVLAALGDPRWQDWIKGDLGDFERLRASGEPLAVEVRVLVSKLLAKSASERRAAATALVWIANANPAVLYECWTRVRDSVVEKHHDAVPLLHAARPIL